MQIQSNRRFSARPGLECLEDRFAPAAATIGFYYDHWDTQENWGYKPITLVRQGDTSSSMSVDLTTVAGSAQPGQDYQPLQVTVTFEAGESYKNVNLYLVNDSVVEGLETLDVVLSNPTGGAALGSISSAVVNIANDDASFSFYHNHWDTQENWGSKPITVVRQGYTGSAMTVNLTTVAGSALPGQDYQPLQLTLSFGVGETSKTINLSLLDDAVVESLETLDLVLSNPTGGATLGPISTAVVNIADNDVASPGTLQFSYANVTTNEGWGNVIVYVSRSGGSTGEVSVDYSFADGTAINGSDFNKLAGTLTFASGETTKTIVIPLVNDLVGESTEQFQVILSNPLGGATLGNTTVATVTILDNDPLS